ncbi:MAG TPA: chemotaxis protein CheW, partial [Polyangiaceae bacterium]|nr:chemotaxis protein CheW [Polyangiaceae bacterium]
MNGTSNDLEAVRAELRRAFDQGFREPAAASQVAEHEDMLAIQVGGDAYALRLAEVMGLHSALHLTKVPSAIPEFLGLLGVRGLLAAVYDLGPLLGYPRT